MGGVAILEGSVGFIMLTINDWEEGLMVVVLF